MPSNTEVVKRIGNEDKRQREVDAAFQSRNIAELQRLAQGMATGDGRNYARLKLSELTGTQPQYDRPGDSSFSVGKTLGGIAKIAAPVLAATGAGLPIAAAVGGAGGLLSGGGLKGAATGALGGLAGGALGRMGGIAGIAGPVQNAGGEIIDVASEGALRSGGRGLLGGISDFISRDPMKAAGIGLAGLNIYQGAKQQGRANEINTQLLQQAQAQQAERDRARQVLMGRLGQSNLGAVIGGA